MPLVRAWHEVGSIPRCISISGDCDTNAFTGAAGQFRYWQSNGNTLVFGDTNGDGTADFMFQLDVLHTLGSGDFIL